MNETTPKTVTLTSNNSKKKQNKSIVAKKNEITIHFPMKKP